MNQPPITRHDALQMLRRRLRWLEQRIAEPAHRPTSPGGFMIEKEAAAIRFAIDELQEARRAS